MGSTSNGSTGGTGTPVSPPPPVQQLQTWTNSSNGIQFTMVGTDPSIPGAGTTAFNTVIIPVGLNFGGTTLTPEASACYDNQDAVTRTINSPLFTNNSWNAFGVPMGNTQFGDAYQRGNFWYYVGPGTGVSPNYHVLLQPVTLAQAVNVDVPPEAGAITGPSPNCPSEPFASVDLQFMNQVVAQAIQSQGITPSTLPIFLTYDVLFTPENFLGYHSSQSGQTYIVASYMDTSGPTGYNYIAAADVAVLSHEVGEWMNNPLGVNQVPPWGTFGIQQTCGDQLEVGDPLTQNIYAFPQGDFTYHMQELAFASWFLGNVPSFAVNQQYSTEGYFTSPAPPCL